MPAWEMFHILSPWGKLGKTLGKTTGWIHRTNIKKKGVTELSGCQYLGVSDEGFKIKTGDQEQILPVDTVVICAGQEPLRELLLPLSGNVVLDGHKFSYASFTYKYFYTENERDNKPNIFMIGGALEAGELDAKSFNNRQHVGNKNEMEGGDGRHGVVMAENLWK